MMKNCMEKDRDCGNWKSHNLHFAYNVNCMNEGRRRNLNFIHVTPNLNERSRSATADPNDRAGVGSSIGGECLKSEYYLCRWAFYEELRYWYHEVKEDRKNDFFSAFIQLTE